MVEMRAPGLKRDDADVLKATAKEAEKAAAANDKSVFEQAISSMEHQLEKILDSLEDLIKEKEHETESIENLAPSDVAGRSFLEVWKRFWRNWRVRFDLWWRGVAGLG